MYTLLATPAGPADKGRQPAPRATLDQMGPLWPALAPSARLSQTPRPPPTLDPPPTLRLPPQMCEFQSDAFELDGQECVMSLIAYPTISVRRDVLDAAVRRLAAAAASPSPSPAPSSSGGDSPPRRLCRAMATPASSST